MNGVEASLAEQFLKHKNRKSTNTSVVLTHAFPPWQDFWSNTVQFSFKVFPGLDHQLMILRYNLSLRLSCFDLNKYKGYGLK